MAGVALQRLGDLDRQLAGWRQDQRLRFGGLDIDLLEQRQREGGGLAGAGLRLADEVMAGFGRTGAWFAFQREDLSGGVTPDIVTFAKGVGGGFPMGGMISFGAELSALFTPGSHGSTFAGNPLGASAALATLGVIEEDNLVDNAEERGKQLRDGIASCGNPLFVSVRGRGLLDAIELAHPCSHAAMNWALEHGLIVNAVAPNALRLAPPLVITAQDVDQAVSILAKIPSDLPND